MNTQTEPRPIEQRRITETEPSGAQPLRALALDALRGIAILFMCLSGRVPFGELALPAWMYHAQNPPPSGALNTAVAGYTWVDLVFPMFLFSMGVAFPFAFTSRLARGASRASLCLSALLRGLSLVAFAIYVEHIRPGTIDPVGTAAHMASLIGSNVLDPIAGNRWMLAFMGFLLLFPVLTRLPASWGRGANIACRVGGLLLIAGFLALLRYRAGANGTTFNVNRADIIILVLANMAFFASVIWLFTSHSLGLRLCFLYLGLLGHLTAYNEYAWVNALEWTPAPWIYRLVFLKYLLVVIPGTIVGDMLLAWMRQPREAALSTGWSRQTLLALSLTIFGLIVFLHAGLQARWILACFLVTCATCAALWIFMRGQEHPGARFLRQLFLWGTLWLLAGLFFEPIEGGIKKTPSNMSYYLTSLGLSIFALFSLTVWIDILGWKRPFHLLIANGQNPMIAYVGINNLMAPFFALPPVAWIGNTFFKATPWIAGTWSIIMTTVLALMTAVFTRWKIYWRT